MTRRSLLEIPSGAQCFLGAEARLRLGNDIYEDWEHLAAFETLLAEGLIARQSGPNRYGLSARGQLVAARLFERDSPVVTERD